MVHPEVQGVLRATRQRKWPLASPQCYRTHSAPLPKLNTHRTPPMLNPLLMGTFRKIFSQVDLETRVGSCSQAFLLRSAFFSHYVVIESMCLQLTRIPHPIGYTKTGIWPHRVLFRNLCRLNDMLRWGSLFSLYLSGWYKPGPTGDHLHCHLERMCL